MSAKSVLALCLGLFVACTLAAPKNGKLGYRIPDYMKLCHRSDPNLDKCLKETIQVVVPSLSNGAREFRLPGLDPFLLTEMRMDYTNGSIEGSIITKDMRFTGISKVVVKDVRSTFKEDGKVAIDVDVYFPKIFAEGAYKMGGRVFDLVLNAGGNYNITMTDVSATWWIRGIPEDRDGKTYLRIVHFDMRPDVGNMVIGMDKIFEGAEEMSNMALAFFNENWAIIYEELLPLASFNWDKVMTSTANMIFQKVPFDVLLPA